MATIHEVAAAVTDLRVLVEGSKLRGLAQSHEWGQRFAHLRTVTFSAVLAETLPRADSPASLDARLWDAVLTEAQWLTANMTTTEEHN